jgi:hypothetical protein
VRPLSSVCAGAVRVGLPGGLGGFQPRGCGYFVSGYLSRHPGIEDGAPFITDLVQLRRQPSFTKRETNPSTASCSAPARRSSLTASTAFESHVTLTLKSTVQL